MAVLNSIIYFIRTYIIFIVDFKSIYNRSKESESQLFETAMSQTDISSEEKVQMLKTVAAAKNPDAILHYGFCLEEGNGVEKNLKLAGKCFKEAAKLGSARAQYCLGLCYYHGDCHIRKDKVLAHAWLKKALKDPTKCMEFRKSAIFKYF